MNNLNYYYSISCPLLLSHLKFRCQSNPDLVMPAKKDSAGATLNHLLEAAEASKADTEWWTRSEKPLLKKTAASWQFISSSVPVKVAGETQSQ